MRSGSVLFGGVCALVGCATEGGPGSVAALASAGAPSGTATASSAPDGAPSAATAAAPSASYASVLPAATPPTSAAAPAGSRSVDATPPGLTGCSLPAKRPADFGVMVARHQLRHAAPDLWEGTELHAAGQPCPADPAAAIHTPCREAASPALDRVYERVVESRLCELRRLPSSPPASPHYGFRSITVSIGGRHFEVSDSGHARLDEDSYRRFSSVFDAVVRAASP